MGENPNTDAPIRMLLADDHTMFREGLAGVLASYGDIEVIAEVPNDERVLRLARQERPDVVVMQVQMPFERAKESLRQIRRLPDRPKVVVVTMFESPPYMRELMGLGASAYLVKTASSGHLIGAIRAAVSDPKGENAVVGMPRGLLEEAEGGSSDVLSAREIELLLLAARGLSNQQIAARAHIAVGTVKRHLANVYEKMGVGSRGEATRMALQEEWITIQDVTDDLDGAEGEQ
jgi:DNA-binding NarL/FixJ family response regulator